MEQKQELKEKEGVVSKLAKAGLLFIASGRIAGSGKNSAAIRAGITTAGMFALNRDDEYGSDLMAASLFIGAAAAGSYGKNKMLQNPQNFIKGYNMLKRADEVLNKTIMFSTESTAKITEEMADRFKERKTAATVVEQFNNKNYLGVAATLAKDTVSVGFDTATSGIRYLANNGVSKSIEALSYSKLRVDYETNYKNSDLDMLMSKYSMQGTTYKSGNGFMDTLKERFPVFRMFGSADSNPNIRFNAMRKYQNIEKNSFFSDLAGIYTKVEGNTIKADYVKMTEQGANTLDSMTMLARNFRSELGSNGQAGAINEANFVNWLKRKGMDSIVDNLYKNGNHISIGEYNDEIMNKLKNGDSDVTLMFSRGKGSVNKHFKQKKLVDNSTIIDDTGLRDLDLLRNFSFTEVVTKNNGMLSDKTALNGQIATLRLAGLVEKSTEAFYKNPMLSGRMNKWNPFAFIDSDSRIKNVVQNKFSTLNQSGDSILLDGYKFTAEREKNVINFAKSATDTFYKENRKTVMNMYDNSFLLPNSMPERNDMSYKDMFESIKKNGFKAGMQEIINSHSNPLPIYYDNGIKFIKEGGYYTERPFFSGRIDKNNIGDSKILNYMEDKGKANKFMKFIFGSSKDMNLDQVKVDNNRSRAARNLLVKSAMSELDSAGFGTRDEIVSAAEATSAAKIKALFEAKTKELEEIGAFNNSAVVNSNGDVYTQDTVSAIFGNKKKSYNEAYNEAVEFLRGVKNHTGRNEVVDNLAAGLISEMKTAKDASYFSNSRNLDFLSYETMKNLGKSGIVKDAAAKGADAKFLSRTLNSAAAIIGSEENAYSHTLNFLNKGVLGADKNIKMHNMRFPMSDKRNVYNNMFETAFGFEMTNVMNKHGNTITSALESVETKMRKGAVTGSFAGTIGDDLEMMYGNTGGIGGAINSILNYKDKFKFNSHRAFNNLELPGDAKIDISDFKKSGFFEYMDKFNEFKLKKVGEDASSMILEDSMKRIAKDKNILESVREFVNHMMYSDGKNTFNSFLKTPISKVQDALEFIGVQRLDASAMGENWTSHYSNFFAKRVLPIFGLIAGATAINAASDAFVPDDVPIIGNGMFAAGVKGVAATRIGIQYAAKATGMLALGRTINDMIPGLVDNGFTNFLDPLMDPGEMIDVYFGGKEVRINENRGWFTSGRQDGRGEEFMQHRQHMLYTLGNRDAGIFDNKVERFFREDFLPTSLAWTLVDPYLEEKRVFEKYGARYPKSQQLFKDIPVFGHLMSATLGELIKPTRYFVDGKWQDGGYVENPYFKEGDDEGSRYVKVDEGNRFAKAIFEGVEDLKTFAGMQGYLFDQGTRILFGKSNPYEDTLSFSSLDQHHGWYRAYDELQLGDLFGITEPIRRLIDKGDNLGQISVNPMRQNLPDWMPGYLGNGDNYFMKTLSGQRMTDNIFDNYTDLEKLSLLSKVAPNTEEFDNLNNKLFRNIDNMTSREKISYYESVGFANDRGRDTIENFDRASDLKEMTVRIDKVVSANEFISEGRRFKLDGIEDNFNKLSAEVGEKRALSMFERNRGALKQGSSITFTTSENERFGAGTDDDGHFIRVYSKNLAKGMGKNSSFNRDFRLVNNSILNAAMPSHLEKLFGIKSSFAEWSNETVQTKEFRDWATPYSSFIEPYENLSSNSFISNLAFGQYSALTTNGIPMMSMVHSFSKANLVANKILNRYNVSAEYKDETALHNAIDEHKSKVGAFNSADVDSSSNIRNVKNTLNENDRKFFNELLNTTSSSERNQMDTMANQRMVQALEAMRSQRQEYIDGTFRGKRYSNEKFDEKTFKLENKQVQFNRLDKKKLAYVNAYKGTSPEAGYISGQLGNLYGGRARVTGTIMPTGSINIIRGERDD